MYSSEKTTPIFTSCIVPDGGYPTQDGYLRVLTKPRKEGGKLKMLHRLEWEKVNGLIPDGYEVDHRCKNRMCQNTNHMQILTRKEHRSKDNAQRNLSRTVELLKWVKDNPTKTHKAIAEKFEVTQSAVTQMLKRYSEIY